MTSQTAGVVFALTITLVASRAIAQPSAPAQAPPPRFGIIDNSFVVEESFNQDPGVFQNIFVMTRSRTGDWDGSFTQEWPVKTERHQLSVTLPFSIESHVGAIGDVLFNYRLQVWDKDHDSAFAPRASLVIPTSRDGRAVGVKGSGCQFNLPFSQRFGVVYVHENAGVTLLRDAKKDATGEPEAAWSSSPFVAGSVIVAVRPMFNLMLETYAESDELDSGSRGTITTIIPGFRTGWNLHPRHQVVVGFGVPVTTGAHHDKAALIYLSYELPFSKKQ
jgi:hypothetical protein